MVVYTKNSSVFILLLIIVSNLQADTLRGKIVSIRDNGSEFVPKGIQEILINTHSIKPDEIGFDGSFSLSLLNKNLYPGTKIRIVVKKKGWSILYPYNAESYIPLDLSNKLAIKLISNNSKVTIENYEATFQVKQKDIIDYGNGFFIQITATSELNKAKLIKSALIEKGFKTIFYKKSQRVDNGTYDDYYKLILGPFKHKYIARSKVRKIKNESIYKNAYIIPH